jgi:hypothetical protein
MAQIKLTGEEILKEINIQTLGRQHAKYIFMDPDSTVAFEDFLERVESLPARMTFNAKRVFQGKEILTVLTNEKFIKVM